MRRAVVWLLLLAGACRPAPPRAFLVGLYGPQSLRVMEEARRLGLAVVLEAPELVDIADAGTAGVEGTASAARLRYAFAKAAARGREGVLYRAPLLPPGRDWLDYPEEWQALTRAVDQAAALRSVLERGVPQPAFEGLAPGLASRVWTLQGRRYAVLVNEAGAPRPLDAGRLSAWRALFQPRADPREALVPCGESACLAAETALWLEGRPGSRP